MKSEPYKNYKPANSAWLSSLPESWDQTRGRFIMAVNPPARRARALADTDEVSFVPMEAVGEYGGLDLERTKQLDEIGSGYTAFQDGDVVIAKITPCFENGKGAIANGLKNGVGFGTTELHVLRPGKHLNKQFLFYLTISHTFRMLGESEMYGAGGQKRVPPEFVKDFRIPLPPIDEQQTIARFLDTKTAQIDELIAKKRQLIDKLKEKRQAHIARTVTRGLPPEAARAAGLSASLESWEQIRGRFVMAVNPPAPRARALDDTDEVSFVPMEAVGEYGGLDLERTKQLDEIGSGYTAFQDGDVVIAKITPCFENGKGAIANGLKNGVGFGTTELHVLRPGKHLNKQFLFYLTISHTFRMLGESEMYGAGGQKRVPPEFVKDFRIPLPPIDEQQTIARFLDAKTAQIDELIAKKRQIIDKLKEYRQALITSAVTGKIDVREVA
jgi:type I restriction enzyme S subunit